MKRKKVTAWMLAGLMTFSLAACGNDGGNAGDAGNAGGGNAAAGGESEAGGELSGKLVLWALAVDMEQFADRFTAQHPGVEIEVVVTAPADYPTTVQAALGAGQSTPDIIMGEPQMLGDFFDAGFFEDLDQAPYNFEQYADQLVDYMVEVGKDENGVQRAVSYQICPAGFFYRRSIAKEVFGSDDPQEVGKLFSSYDSIIDAGRKLKDAGYRIFASEAETSYFSGDSAWVIDGKLNVDPSRMEYMDMCVELWQEDLTAYAAQWAAPWYQAMGGPVPILTAETQWGTDEMNVWDADSFAAATKGMDTAEVFAFGLPSWGAVTMRDNAGDTAGDWAICGGPAYGFGGGSWLGINTFSENKELAWEFIKFATLDMDTATWWGETSQGDVSSLVAYLEAHAEDVNPVYNQQTNKLWLELAEGIDYSKVTRYDTAIGNAWGAAITKVKENQMDKAAAIGEFFDEVAATYPDIEIDRDGILSSLGL